MLGAPYPSLSTAWPVRGGTCWTQTGWYSARWLLMNDSIQLRYAAGVRCAAGTVVAKSTHRRRLAGPPPGDWLAKSTMRSGWLWAMTAMSSGSEGSTWPLRSCALAAAENPILLLVSSWASAAFLALSVAGRAALYAAAPPG